MRFAPHSTEVTSAWETRSAYPDVLTSAIASRGRELASDAQ
jgi:hypothetical protein